MGSENGQKCLQRILLFYSLDLCVNYMEKELVSPSSLLPFACVIYHKKHKWIHSCPFLVILTI